MSHVPPPPDAPLLAAVASAGPGAPGAPVAAAGAPRWVGDTEQARLTIPYLGANPAPSRPVGIALQASAAVMVVLSLVRVGLYLWLASIDRSLIADQTQALLSQTRTAHRVISILALVALVLLATFLALEIAWRSRRRPKKVCADYGEAYVEFPTRWVTPKWLFGAWVALVVGVIAVGQAGAVRTGTLLAQLPHRRDLAALAATMSALLWASFILWVALVNRSHDQRLARSTAYRADPTTVPYFPPAKRAAGIG